MPDVGPTRPGSSAPRLLLIATVLGGLVLAALGLPLDEAVTTLRTWATDEGTVGMLGFAAAYTLGALLFVPGALLTVVTGGLFGLGRGILLVVVATSCADAIAFLISRYLARDAVERVMAHYPRFGAFDRAITRGGWWVVALLRLSPTIPYSASNYLYGLTGLPFLPYLVTSGIFTLPGICAYVYLGHVGAETIAGEQRRIAEWTLLLVGFAATVLATLYLAILARRELARQDAG